VRVAYANCFLPDGESPDLLVTDEVAVAEAFPGQGRIAEAYSAADPEFPAVLADANAFAWRLAFGWFEDHDPTVVDGISAADIAGSQVALSLLIPALRGVLDARAVPDGADRVELWMPGNGSERYRAVERIQAESFAAALGPDVRVERRVSDDARNAALVAKYEQVRDPEWLAPEPRAARAQAQVAGMLIGARGALSRRDSLLVYEYNPTNAFAARYAAERGADRRFTLARCRTPRPHFGQIPRAGDRFVLPPTIPPGSDPVELGAGLADRFTFAGVDLWPLLEPGLAAVVGRYRAYVGAVAPRWRVLLRRNRVRAVLMPFDSPPEARLLVRVAQSEGIPTFAVNDGFKGDDFTVEDMTADHALAWSESIARNYFGRRTHGDVVVTGNPKGDAQRTVALERRLQGALREVLIGSFTFSPVDIACHRSDAENFLRAAVAGIRQSERGRDAAIRVKLHPADRIDHYAGMIDDGVEFVTDGDVVQMFDDAELYITTYSTSLLEAIATGLPSIYLRINDQRLHAPFSADDFMERRTARTREDIARLIDDPGGVFRLPPAGERERWIEQYLGPADGRSVERIEAAISERL
jgi:hypothetical protein